MKRRKKMKEERRQEGCSEKGKSKRRNERNWGNEKMGRKEDFKKEGNEEGKKGRREEGKKARQKNGRVKEEKREELKNGKRGKKTQIV